MQTDNILVIDNSTDISYHKSVIDSNYTFFPDLDELFNIYKEEHSDIFKCQTDKCLTLILNDNSEIPLCRYTDECDVRFLKIFNKDLSVNNNEILIATDLCHGIKYNSSDYWAEWQRVKMIQINQKIPDYHSISEQQQIEIAKTDYNGFQNCIDIKQSAENIGLEMETYIPLIYNHLRTKIIINNIIYQSYVPAAGQMIILFKYLYMINYICYILGIDNIIKKHYWTSSEHSCDDAWVIIDYPKDKHELMHTHKSNSYINALPMFKKIN